MQGGRNPARVEALLREMTEAPNDRVVPSDVLGSYTGMTADGETPVQDADDL